MPKKPHYAIFFSTYLAQDIDEKHQGEKVLDCPFHDCENPTDHFYANCDTGEWHCKRCDKSGNARTLLTLLHAQYYPTTTKNQYLSLSEVRGLSVQTLRDVAKLAYDTDNDRWLVPYFTYNPDTKSYSKYLNNLGYFYPSSRNENRYTVKKASALPLYLYDPGHHPCPPSNEAIICEGEWDTWAYIEAHSDSEDMILGKPGSGFSLAMLQTLKKIDTVTLLLDNDDAGRKQTASSVNIIQTKIKDIKTLDWLLVEDAPKDIRALWMKLGVDMPSVISDAIIPYDVEPEERREILGSYQTCLGDYTIVPNFTTYLETTSKFLYLPDETKLAMAATLGITSSISIPGEPLWAFLIGPPSCGKTTFIDSFGGNNELFDNLSKISAKALVSGWKDETGEEPSYLKKLRDKTLFVKDFTVTLTDSPDSQREVFGLLTDIFDGYVKIPYGNNEVKEFYDLYFNMVAGVTDIVHKHSAASIGERFLRIDYLGRKYDAREFARRAVANFGLAKSQKTTLVANTLGFINHLRSLPINMEIDEIYQEPITDLAEFIATIRTKVEADKEGIQYRPRTELPSRLAFTLCKLFVSVRNVYIQNPDRDEDKEIASALAFEVVKKVSLDTCYGFPLDIIRTIQRNPSMTKQQLAEKAKIHAQRAYRVLADLITTGVITNCDGRVGARGGRPAHHYSINPKLISVLDYDPSPILPKKSPPKKPLTTKTKGTKKVPTKGIKKGVKHAPNKTTTKRPKPKRPPNRS